MRPLKLKMQAFSSYSKAAEIDFTKLNGLFLISGSTGAGKTTIFDAMTYALYGETSGKERSEKNLRSLSAPPDAVTSVEFTFEHDGKEYRIVRKTGQVRPKKRGNGTTVEKPSVEMYLPNRKTLNKNDAVVSEVKGLIGLDAEQWRQVAMLAQGKFRKMLDASSKERGAILDTIFGTEKYTKVCEVLADEAEGADDRIDRAESAIRDKLGLLVTDDGSEIASELGKSIEGASLIEQRDRAGELLKKVSEADEGMVAEAERAAEEAKKALREASDKLTEAKTLKDYYDKWRTACARSESLSKGSERFTRLEKEISDTDAAVIKVLPAEEKLRSARSSVDDLQRKATAAKKEAESAKAEEERAAEAYEEASGKASEESSLREKASKLEAYLPNYETAEKARRNVEELRGQLDDAARAYDEADSELAEATEEADRLGKELDLDKDISGRIEASDQKVREAEGIIRKLRVVSQRLSELADAEAKCSSCSAEYSDLVDESNRLEAEFSDKKKDFFENQAGYIASKLREGDPCPVCGSTSHPHLARPPSGSVTEDDYKRSERMSKEASDKALRYLKDTLSVARADSERLKAAADTEISNLPEGTLFGNDEAAVSGAISDCEARLDAERKANEGLRRQEDHLEGCRRRIKTLEGVKKDASGRKEEAKSAQSELEKRIAKAEAETKVTVDPDYRDTEAARKAIDDWKADADRLKTAIEEAAERHRKSTGARSEAEGRCMAIGTQLENAQEEVGNCVGAFENAVSAAGFADEDEYRVAVSRKESLESMRQELGNYRKEQAEADADRKSLEESIGGRPEPEDIPGLEDARNAADASWQEAFSASEQAKYRRGGNRRTSKEIVSMYETSAKELGTLFEIKDLSNVANGKENKAAGTFAQFVQARYLDMILDSANRRLGVMSSGRYELRRSLEAVDGRSSHALDLDVLDNDDQKVRPVSTLSGGESFKAALSMALGLSDVIQRIAGGRTVDALFVDEGFGSLDPESLKQAISVLSDLSGGNKMVGVISHTEELQRSIQKQILVSYDPKNGSTLRIRTD